MILLMYNIFKNIKNTGMLTCVFYYVLRYNKKTSANESRGLQTI